MFGKPGQEGINFAVFALHVQFHGTIIGVADGAGEGQAFGKLQGGHTEAHALDSAGEGDDATLDHGYRLTGRRLYAEVRKIIMKRACKNCRKGWVLGFIGRAKVSE